MLAAFLLHAALIVAARTVPLSPDASTSLSPLAEPEAIDLDLEPEERPPALAPAPQLLAANAPLLASRQERALPRASTPEPSPSGAPAPEPSALPVAPAASEYGPAEKPSAIPGLDGPPVWALPGVLPSAGPVSADPAPVVPPAPSIAPGPLRVALDYLHSGAPPSPFPAPDPIQHFPAAGKLASVLADEVRSSSTPAESEGAFELVIDRAGHLTSVSVIAADPAHRKEWERVARVVAQRFAGETLALPGEFAAGSRIRIAVQSKMTMPDGTAHGIPVPKLKLQGLPDEHTIQDPAGDPNRNTLRAAPPAKPGLALSFSMDLANIGAKRRRVVRTRVHAAPLVPGAEAGATGAGRR